MQVPAIPGGDLAEYVRISPNFFVSEHRHTPGIHVNAHMLGMQALLSIAT